MSAIRANGPVLIKGVAGSGKTTIGLYRANYLAQHARERRTLIRRQAAKIRAAFDLYLDA